MAANARAGQPKPTAQELFLRLAFVEMLFALAASQVAIKAADLQGVTASLCEKMPAILHLVLGLSLIALSWVGWQKSVERNEPVKEKVKYWFSLAFLGLILDVFLVTLYFIVVRNVEIRETNGIFELSDASAVPESYWIIIVFLVYAAWDILGDVLESAPDIWTAIKLAVVCVPASLVCAVLSYVVYLAATQRLECAQVLYLDGALLCVVFLFRNLKVIEEPLAQWFKVTDSKPFKKPRERSKCDPWLCGILFVAYLVCMVGAFDFSFGEIRNIFP